MFSMIYFTLFFICMDVKVSYPLERDLQTVEICHVGTGNWTSIPQEEQPMILTAESTL